MDSGTAVAALTDNDEMNIVCCMQAKQLGVGSTIARIDKPEYVPIIDNFAIVERVVSPYLSLIREILRCVHGESVINVGLFHRISGELQEVAIMPRSKWIGKRLSKARLPGGMIIAAVQRQDETFVPTGNFVFKEDDLLVVYCLQKTAHKVRSIFK
jgi:trk system potassium uptake protein TrkA